jgi:hypothetical protein
MGSLSVGTGKDPRNAGVGGRFGNSRNVMCQRESPKVIWRGAPESVRALRRFHLVWLVSLSRVKEQTSRSTYHPLPPGGQLFQDLEAKLVGGGAAAFHPEEGAPDLGRQTLREGGVEVVDGHRCVGEGGIGVRKGAH